MEFKDVATQFFERSNAMQAFWGYYITIALALVTFFGASPRSRRLASVLTAAFLGVAAVNLDGMTDVARQRLALWTLLQDHGFRVSPDVVQLYTAARPPAPCSVVVVHLFCDAIVVAAIWLLTLSGEKSKS